MYSLSEDRSELKLTHTLILPQPPGMVNAIRVGPVSSLEFSTDGHVVAVGWYFGGLSVWAVSGKLLLSTISEEILSESP